MDIIIMIVRRRAQPVWNLSVLMSMPMIREAPAALQPLMTARPTAPRPHTPHVDPFSTCKHRNLCYCPVSSSLPDPQHQVPTLHTLTRSPHLTETSVITLQPVPLECSQRDSSTVMQRGMNQWVNVRGRMQTLWIKVPQWCACPSLLSLMVSVDVKHHARKMILQKENKQVLSN